MKRAILLILAIVIIFFIAPCFIKNPMQFIPIAGISMNPVLQEGDLILYKEVSVSEVDVGDIIIYGVPSTIQNHNNCPPIVTHRVVSIVRTKNGLYYRTMGDNNLAQDPWKVRHSDVIGKVTERISYVGFPLLFLQSPSGLIFTLVILFTSALCLYANELSKVGVLIRCLTH